MRWAAVLLLVGCVQTNARFCEDGRICPEGRLCDDVHDLCVSQDQKDQCRDKPDHSHCVSDVTTGQCDQGVCIPGCGDGVQQAGETCDDGGYANHDGCSSVCELEVGSWREVPKYWVSRAGHTAAYDSARQKLVIFGGLTQASATADAGITDDTWERSADGTWRQLDIVGPPPRQNSAMAYDVARGVIVLFGGVATEGNVLGDTWEFDGTAWTQKTPTVSPPVRRLHAMAYDSTRQRVLVYGGASETLAPLGDLWEFDGTTWAPVATTGTPPLPRYSTHIAYDDNRDRLVVFSGSRLDEETWELAPNGAWSLMPVTNGPPDRFAGGMTYDPVGQRVLLFAGDDFGGTLNDLWSWDGTTWTFIAGSRTPAPRRAHTLTSVGTSVVLVAGTAELSDEPFDDVWTYEPVEGWKPENLHFTPSPRSATPFTYDPVRDELVMYGGMLLHNDTWTFDGTRWFEKQTPQTNGLRTYHSQAWDAARQRVVIYGGLAGGGIQPLEDTWAWDGVRWTRVQAPVRPSPRGFAAFAGNASGVLVLYGGGSTIDLTNPFRETWELDGATWRRIETATVPGPAFGPSMVYDPEHDRMVLFDSDGATWTYRDGDWTLLVPTSEAPGPRNFPTLVYHEARGRVVLYGGTLSGNVLADLWELDGTMWRRVNVAGEPPAAQFSSVGYHRKQRAIVLFGGARSNVLDQTWEFRYESALPDEICTNGIDDDQDGLSDCADPDCIYHACPN